MNKQKEGFAPIIIILVVTILLVGAYFLVNKKGNLNSIISFGTPVPITASLSTSILPEESIQNGVYTNTKYGFMFNYPQNIFNYSYLNTDGSNKDNLYRQFFISTTGLSDSLSISVSNGQNLIKYFEDFQKLKLNTLYPPQSSYINESRDNWPRSIAIRTKDLQLGSYPGFITYNYPSGGGISDGEAFYNASWKIGDKVYTITLLTSGKSSLDKYTITFDNIVDSFQLIAK